MAVLGAVWQQEGFQGAEFVLVDVLAQAPGVGMAIHTVIAVECGQHALQQRGGGVPVGMQGLMVGQPALPAAIRLLQGVERIVREHQHPEPVQPSAQCAHCPLAAQAVVGVDDGAQKIRPLAAALQNRFCGVQQQAQPLVQKCFNAGFVRQQGLRVVSEQDKVVNVAYVAAHLEAVLDELVKLIEVDVGKKLAGEAADGHAHTGLRAKERFVRRYARQQGDVTAAPGRRLGWRLLEDGGGHLVQQLAGARRPGQSGQGGLPQLQQDAAVNSGKKGPDVELAVPAVPGLAHEVLQAPDGGLRALALAVGKAVVYEPLVPPGFYVLHQPLLDQPVGEGRGKDFAQLRVGDGKDGKGAGPVVAAGNVMRQGKHHARQIQQVRTLVLAVAGLGGTGKQLPGNVGFSHGELWSELASTRRFLQTCSACASCITQCTTTFPNLSATQWVSASCRNWPSVCA